MKIEHIAIWAGDIEKLKTFYMKYFGAVSNRKYINSSKSFESYFLTFINGTRLELMKMPDIPENRNNPHNQSLGLIHIAFSAGSRQTQNS